jgi:hypothetical protein
MKNSILLPQVKRVLSLDEKAQEKTFFVLYFYFPVK